MVKLDQPYQIEIAGVGGTGVLTAASLLGNAALIQGLYAVQSEIHGMAQRGGVVNTEVRIGPVNGPLIPDGQANVLLSFELSEAARAIRKIIPHKGYVIINTHRIIPPSLSSQKGVKYPSVEVVSNIIKQFTNNYYFIDAFKLAEEAGDLRTQNVVLVGALFALPDFPLTKESVRKALEINFQGKEKVIEINMKTFELGYSAIKQLMK